MDMRIKKLPETIIKHSCSLKAGEKVLIEYEGEATKPLVRLTGPGTDMTFSIKGIPAVKCDGKMNLPDGEVYTAPVRDSINGTIRYIRSAKSRDLLMKTYSLKSEREGL